MKKRILGRGLAITLALAFSLTTLAAAICLPATTQPLMLRLMARYAPPADTRLPEAEYPAVAEMITDYLSGRTDAFQHVFTVDGTEYAAFNAKEQHHMADVQDLFQLCRTLLWAGLALTAALAAALALLREKRTIVWFRRTLISILTAVTIVIILACIDFDSLFVLFHKVAFTNDLWLLDPRTDLLIRLMPIEFFISYAAIIGGLWLTGMVGLLILATIRIKKMQDKGE